MTISDALVAKWLERIIGHEGGYSNDPEDPGGETKWGISKRSYHQLNIADLTVEEAAILYQSDYLQPLEADKLRPGVVYQLLDFGVNSSIETAKRIIQREIGVADDGIIGPVTREALAERSESDVVMLLLAGRLDYLTRLSKWPHFSRGWARRIAQNLRYGAEDTD